MEDKKKSINNSYNINNLNGIICQECGLPLLLGPYKINESNKILIQFNCRKSEHKKIQMFDFENFQSLINNKLNNIFKCMFCQTIIESETTNYCKDCQKIICLNCTRNHYHQNIVNYDGISHNNSLTYISKGSNEYIFNNFRKDYIKKSNQKNTISESKDEQKFKNSLNSENQINDESDILNHQSNKYINIIYHDENIKKSANYSIVVKDAKFFESKINGSLLITNDSTNLLLVLDIIKKNKLNSKFILIINGGSSENIINNFIYKSEYDILFLGAIIYTTNQKRYLDLKKKNSDFVKGVKTSKEKIIDLINIILNNENFYSDKLLINQLVTEKLYKIEFKNLKEELKKFQGDESENSYNENFEKIKEFIIEEDFPNEMKNKIIEDYKIFSELKSKNYEKIIKYYLNNYYFAKIMNLLLDKKDISIYKKIGYFAGNLMHCIEEYGKKAKKGVKSKKIFFSGMQLNIIDVLQYYRNISSSIAFPYFLSMTTKKELAEMSSKRNIPDTERKKKAFFSVILQIEYLYEENEKPCAFELKDLSPIPAEEEYILFPFSFMRIKDVKINSDNFIVDISLEIKHNN